MKKILQINSVVNKGSTGKIAEGIANVAIKNNWDSYIAYGRDANQSKSKLIKISNKLDLFIHVFYSRIFDRHGFASKYSTRKFINKIKDINPDIIHLHNIHGYYINIELLFNFLKDFSIPIVWTLHDSWSYTGHCAYYVNAQCEKWEKECYDCPIHKSYPESFFIDQSSRNFKQKKYLFNLPQNITIVTPSKWLKSEVKKSFLNSHKIMVINNGINLDEFRYIENNDFKKKHNLNGYKIVLGVASEWSKRKGLDDIIKLSEKLDSTIKIILVGITAEQKKDLSKNILAVSRTDSIRELAEIYSIADVFINPTKEDNFPTTNLEALACGTPIVTYKTGGSPESIDENVGIVVQNNTVDELFDAIMIILKNGKEKYFHNCREKAKKMYNQDVKFLEYLDAYKQILINK